MVLAKSKEEVPCWQCFVDNDEQFPNFFSRVLYLAVSDIDLRQKSVILRFVALVMSNLDVALLRKHIAPLVSIQLWHHISSDKRDAILQEYPRIRKAWKSAEKKFQGFDRDKRSAVEVTRAWLSEIVIDFYSVVMKADADSWNYIERFLEFIIVMLSQLPTRRYTNTLLKDYNLMGVLHLYIDSTIPAAFTTTQLVDLLTYYLYFPIDDFTGNALTRAEQWKRHGQKLEHLQQIAYFDYHDKLRILALSNHASIYNRPDMEEHLSVLTLDELKNLAHKLHMKTDILSRTHSIAFDSRLIIEGFYQEFQKPIFPSDGCRLLSTLPDEHSLFSGSLEQLEFYEGKSTLAIHRLGLQYLSLTDFLVRNFHLFRLEAFSQVRADLEKALVRFTAKHNEETHQRMDLDSDDEEENPNKRIKLYGSSRMAAKINGRPTILDISLPAVGQDHPAQVSVEVTLELETVPFDFRREWESLRPQEVVYLVALIPADKHSTQALPKLGIQSIWSGEVIQVLDEKNQGVRPDSDTENGYAGRRLKLHINLDGKKFVSTSDPKSVISGLNVVVRRRQRENNFKPILDNILEMIESERLILPDWLNDLILGFGDGQEKTKPTSFDYWDTFLDLEHFRETYPEQVSTKAVDEPPIVVEHGESGAFARSYKMPYSGPYNEDKRRTNSVRFTARQVESIVDAAGLGLTLVVGPPGTGKTDVASQVLNLLYHNYPEQRILVIAHSNQALNHIFQKIAKLDIDPRHLLRLGHSQDDLGDYSLFGRVDKLTEARIPLLEKVTKLAESMGIPGDHGDSCETASYFYQVHVLPAWNRYKARLDGLDEEQIRHEFPFANYFQDADYNVNLRAKDIAFGSFTHIERLFENLESLRPLEVLWSNRERANYLLSSAARIVAMTATHAAINLSEIAKLRFHFDTIVMEESGQLTELETLLPMTMGHGKEGSSELQRVVLIGDHYQNTPIIQNNTLRQHCGLGQSLFLRFIRSGVSRVKLDAQGRARPEIASIYAWRYGGLTNLPVVKNRQPTNSGFFYNVQFIDVPEYRNQGESEPSPHFLQNLGEAEYAVALYQYMRLLGYPREKISILTAYYGQKVLVSEILHKRCGNSKIFGIPEVSTVDQYQGQQNDYIIVSMVRTQSIGYLRDIRRVTVALSRARLGLYVVGRRSLLENCADINGLISRLIADREDKLQLVTGEMFGDYVSDRQPVGMESLEHFGQYVHQMTEQRLQYQ